MSGPRVAIGFDIGGTKVLGAVIDERGEVLERYRVPSAPQWPEMLAAIGTVTQALRSRRPDVVALGIGAAGMVDREGTIHYAPNVPGFRRTPVQREVGERTRMPTFVDNDANVAAFGEQQVGAAQGLHDAIVITLGTGIGCGVIAEARILRGAWGFAAEAGHFQIDPNGPMCACGERGHWEAMASGNALGRMAREAAEAGRLPSVLERAGGDVRDVHGQQVSAAARDGNADALALVDEYAFNVAIGLVGLANIFDPAVIAIAGGIVNDGELFLAPMRRHFKGHLEGTEYRTTPEIIPAALGEEAGVVGAGLLALERLDHPLAP